MTKYRKHTKIAEQEQQFSNFLDRSRYSHGQKVNNVGRSPFFQDTYNLANVLWSYKNCIENDTLIYSKLHFNDFIMDLLCNNWTNWKHHGHGVWKSQKKSHSTLRAKRATFTFCVDKKFIKKVPKMVNFGEFLKTWSLRSNSVTK